MRPPKARVSNLGRSVFRALHECFGGGIGLYAAFSGYVKGFHIEVWVDI